MKYLLSFLSGVFVGAVVALFLAPTSGAELREQVRTGAEAEWNRAQLEWRRASTELNAKLDQTNQQLKQLVEQARKETEAEAEQSA